MSKEVNNKVSIAKKLLKKQLFDYSVIFVVLGAIFYVDKFLELSNRDSLIFFLVGFFALIILLKYSTNSVKKPLDNIIITTFERTLDDISSIQAKNNSQKENHNLVDTKIKNMQTLAANLQKYAASMDDLTNQANEKTNKSLSFTNNEYSAVKTNIEKMFSIRHKIQTIAELILELSDFVQSISSTIGLVEDIAEQTNLLALNAAVEAARAGEHGKGFAVVASEIRKLADESKQATTKIISLINDIQQTANSTVLATEEGTKEIESGLELAHIISENIEKLINSMNDISSNMKEVIASSKQINTDSKACENYIEEIAKMAEVNKEITSQNDSIFEKIETTSNDLKQLVI